MSLVDPPPQARRTLATLWRDRRGVSAVEFALIAPVLLLFYCGMAELTEAMMAQRRLSHLTSSIGDVVARQAQLTDAQKTDLFKVGEVLMAPFPTTALHMCVYSVSSDAAGKNTVDWSDPSSPGAANCPAAKAVVTDIPLGVLPVNQSVIVSKATYDYDSPIKLVAPQTLVFRHTFYLRPRVSDKVLRVP
jgi:Flp pilus assembly protein TadG